MSETVEPADVMIVGAGVAGLYCAHRLLTDDPGRRVVVVDLLERVGGRLDTDLVQIKSLDRFDDAGVLVTGRVVGVKEEQGGMRFNGTMTELLALIDALGMWQAINPFGMGDDNNYFHVRGRSFTAGESKANNHAIWAELYDLTPNERNKSPGEIIMAIYRDLVFANGEVPPDNPSPEFWQMFRLDFLFGGVPLYRWGLWSLLRAFQLSPDCIQMLADTSGFQGPFFSTMNAGSAYQLLEDFPLDPLFYALEDGFGSLPAMLTERVRADGGTVLLGTGVSHIDPFERGFLVHTTLNATAIEATALILAIPPLPLERLLAISPGLAPGMGAIRHALDSVVAQQLCKINFYYNHAWWRDHSETRLPQIRNGGSFTTQPLGSVYVFDPLKGEDANGPAALTIYCDWAKTDFWLQLQEIGELFDSPLQREHGAASPQVLFAASLAVVAEATTQLRELFRVISVPQPVLTSYRLWSGTHEFGHAYHQWARGADDRAVMDEVVSPMRGVFICNEAFSDDQGWVNGSLRSANRVLDAGFAIGPLPVPTKVLPV